MLSCVVGMQVDEALETGHEWLNRKASTRGKMVQGQSDRAVRGHTHA